MAKAPTPQEQIAEYRRQAEQFRTDAMDAPTLPQPIVNDAEHGGSEFKAEEVDRFVADLVVCALRMANTCPGRTIDLQRAVQDRIENKNQVELARVKQ